MPSYLTRMLGARYVVPSCLAGLRRRGLSTSAPREVGVAVVGCSGYTGAELIRLLAAHPYAKVSCSPRCPSCKMQLVAPSLDRELAPAELDSAPGSAWALTVAVRTQVRVITANQFAGQELGDVFASLAPHAQKLGLRPLVKLDAVDWEAEDVSVVFACLPHGITQQAVKALPVRAGLHRKTPLVPNVQS